MPKFYNYAIKIARNSLLVLIILLIHFKSFKNENISTRPDYETVVKDSRKASNENICKTVDTSKIGLVYVYIPDRMEDHNRQPNKNDYGENVFKLNHYYSLLMLSKLYKPSKNDRILFYYINDSGKPTSNHYNRWLNDSSWNKKLPLSSIKFIKIDHEYNLRKHDFNMYDIISKIKLDCVKRFDTYKEFYLLTTSDIIVGPKLYTCFTPDMTSATQANNIINLDSIRTNMPNECFKALNPNKNEHSENVFSFLYRLDAIHNQNDFSGILIWNRNYIETSFDYSLVNQFNVYKCVYKNDIFRPDGMYENSFCLFGYELNIYEPPMLQHLFLNKENNYLYQSLRYHLYGDLNPVRYTKIENKSNPKIPNIVHLIWFNERYKGLKFIEYLCLKSILEVLKPDKVRIHGDNKPQCELWKEISKNKKIEWVQMERPLFKYGQNFTSSPIQHLADVARLEVLYNEGGIYSDFDILWVKSVDNLRRMDVELIASNDITSYCNEFPLSIQIGAFLAAPKSSFIKKWLEGYREKYHLYPGDYVAVSMCEPYKLYEKQPDKVYIDNRLQMIYFNGWSAFIPRYIDVDQNKLAEFNQKLDWLNDGTYAYHLPRHGSLFTKSDYEKANKSLLPIRIAEYILNLPSHF